MRVIVFLAIFVVLALLIWFSLVALRGAMTKWSQRRAEWTIEEVSEGGHSAAVYVTCPGKEPGLIGRAYYADDDFDIRLRELTNEAEFKVSALNDTRKRGKK